MSIETNHQPTPLGALGDLAVKRSELIFDSSPLHAVELLSASLHGMLTNPATPWFSLKFKNIELVDESHAVPRATHYKQ